MKNYYAVRLWPPGPSLGHSRSLGFKGRLLSYRRACAVLRFLKRRGHDGYLAKIQIQD